MLKRILKTNFLKMFKNYSTIIEVPITQLNHCSDNVKENIENNLDKVKKPLKVHRTDVSEISKIVRPGVVSSMYVNQSDILQQFVKLGVKLYQIEKDPEALRFILTLKFHDIKDTIIFLKELGIETDKIGYIITKNPFILKENLEDFKVRINYLQYKKFTDQMITRIVENNPLWLTYSTQDIDTKLGYFQNTYSLTGNEVRLLTVKCPKLITYSLSKVKLNTFVIKEEMGFTTEEIKKVLLHKPKIFTIGQTKLLKTFEYLHSTMKIPLEKIVECPEILTCRVKKLKERYLFLDKLGRWQFDNKKPNYIGLLALVSGTDTYFASEVAKSSIMIYNQFLKSL